MSQWPDRHVHTFRQSWLQTYFNCPEQARLVRLDLYPFDQTEASAKGTAVHAGIETAIKDLAPYESAAQRGVDTFVKLAGTEGFRWVKVRRKATALAHIENGLRSWYQWVRPTLGASIWCEHSFKFLFHEDDEREIWLSGTADYADANGLKDWKLTGNQFKYGRDAWQLKRWDVQSTVYAAAALREGLFVGEVPFEFVALSPQGGKPQIVPVSRNHGHVAFLRAQLLGIAEQIEANLSSWPLRDQHALCSPDWCLNYSACKGQYLSLGSEDSPNQVNGD